MSVAKGPCVMPIHCFKLMATRPFSYVTQFVMSLSDNLCCMSCKRTTTLQRGQMKNVVVILANLWVMSPQKTSSLLTRLIINLNRETLAVELWKWVDQTRMPESVDGSRRCIVTRVLMLPADSAEAFESKQKSFNLVAHSLKSCRAASVISRYCMYTCCSYFGLTQSLFRTNQKS